MAFFASLSLSAKDVKSVSLPAADVKCYQEAWSPTSIELQPWIRLIKKKSPVNRKIYRTLCGERGIRTPGTSRYDGFQDRCNRPLYHLSKFGLDDYSLVFLSGCKGTTFFWFYQIFEELFEEKHQKTWKIALKRHQNWRKRHKKRATAVAPTLITLNLILWKTQCKNTKYICSLCIENRKSIF